MGAPRIDRLDKNYIINGNFDFWQRGVSSSAGGYLADRFSFQNFTSAGTFTRTRSTDVPSFAESGYRSTYSDLITVGTADASLAGDERAFYAQIIEGYNLQRLLGKKVTLSFWVKCSKTGTQSVSFNNAGGAGGAGIVSYVATYTINAANTWEKKVITLLMDTSGTWGVGNDYGLSVAWSLGTSPTNQYATGTVNQWIIAPSSGKYHFTGNLNLFDTAAATWRIAQIQLVEGEIEQEFTTAGRNYADELRLCQRYYEKSDQLSVFPGSVSSQNRFYNGTLNGGGGGAHGPVVYAVRKRATPTISYWDGININQAFWRRPSADTSTALTFNNSNEYGFEPVNSTTGGAWTTSQVAFNWAADAEL